MAARTVLKLAVGALALLNCEHVVVDEDMSVEDLLIGLPLLQHVEFDIKKILEGRHNLLDGTNCENTRPNGRHAREGRVGRLMAVSFNHVLNEVVIKKGHVIH